MNFGTITKHLQHYYLNIACVTVMLTSVVCGHAQTDSSFALVRNGETAVFPFHVITDNKQLISSSKLHFPVYGFNATQVSRMRELLNLFVKNESDFDQLQLNSQQRDSIYKIKVALYTEMDSIQELRLNNYQLAYQSVLKVNEQLNVQLTNCEKTALAGSRKQKIKSLLLGMLLGLSTGIVMEQLVHSH
jgi:hypothetical protein